MFEADKGQVSPLNGQLLSIGIVQARFNASITNALAAACIAELQLHGVSAANIHHITVPGALEVPGAACHLDHAAKAGGLGHGRDFGNQGIKNTCHGILPLFADYGL